MGRDVFQVALDGYAVRCCPDGLPEWYESYRTHAVLVDELDLQADPENNCFVGVSKGGLAWPFLVISVGRKPKWAEQEIKPGTLVVPETQRLFLGIQERLLAYDLANPCRLWEDRVDPDREFWAWERHGESVLMAAELEMAAWDLRGRKRWSTFVEPPWDYRVEDDTVHLTVLDVPVVFSLEQGPSWGRTLPWSRQYS
jgi:hypothetical protein